MQSTLSLQEQYAPHNACFGCGPANSRGLKLKSFVNEDEQVVYATWQPKEEYEAFPGVLNGGIIGALLDCHSNWTAAWHLMKKTKAEFPPCTVTASYAVKLLRPTPTQNLIELKAWVKESTDTSAVIEAQLIGNGKVCATCEGKFVAVKPDHPGYYRW